MQKCLFLLFLTFALSSAWGQPTQCSVAIVRLLEKKAATWRSDDINTHADCWQIRPYSRILVSTADGRSLNLAPSIIINPPANFVWKFQIHI